MSKTTYLLACGAIAKELLAVVEASKWEHLEVHCLPALLHNHPDQIPSRVDEKLTEVAGQYDHLLVGYADCGTGGLLDPVLEKHGAKRLPGAHCYSFFAGAQAFEDLANDELGTFYLTDYLVRAFDTVFWKTLGLDRFPELLPMYFGHYTKVVYLVQIPDPELDMRAQEAAARMGLAYERIETGLQPFAETLTQVV